MENNVIGFRVSPCELFYAIVEEHEEEYEFISISSIKIPESIDEPNRLSYIRNIVTTIIEQYNIRFAGIKLLEGNARSSINNGMIFRFNVEGVLKEIFANSSIEAYLLGISTNIASILDVEKKKPVEMLEAFIDINDIKTDSNKKLKTENKESLLVALAAIEMEANA